MTLISEANREAVELRAGHRCGFTFVSPREAGQTMIKKKWVIVAVGLLLLVLVAGVSFWILLTKRIEPGVTPENFRRLYVGLERKEVEAILGKPTSDYGPTLAAWEKNGCKIILYFDNLAEGLPTGGGCMQIGKRKTDLAESPKSPFERVGELVGF